ncbi:hypothetical protein TNCT_470021 [Trichonephila clavata]|uniref:Zinc knuckle domain containing protein n=1 Tax=Trichonephila clavata TaxID=2740835 RepID=A0A8X6K1H5_TRICU|nr:hypothetical protein TNCT_470021 [Trichonephila clavata]
MSQMRGTPSHQPITEKIEDPVCINCHQHGQFASQLKCPKFPKLKPKKGDTIKDKNESQLAKSSNIIPELSFAQALKNNDSTPKTSPLDLQNSVPDKNHTKSEP